MLVGTLLGNRQRTVSVKGMRLGERLMNSLNCCTVSFRPIPALWSSNSYLTMNWWTPPVRGFAVEADVAPSDLDRATGEPDDPISNHTGEGCHRSSWRRRSWMGTGYVPSPSDLDHATGEGGGPISNHTREGSPGTP